MSISLEYLQRCAADTGYAIGPLEKVVRLGEVSAEIARHPFLGDVLVLKGGTALNLGFGAPTRLSVDLDFNYIGHVEREKMLADRPVVEDAVVKLTERMHYRIQRSPDTFAGRKLFLTYPSVQGPDERIEIDLNFLYRIPLEDPTVITLWQPGELDRHPVRAVSLLELCVGKLLALLDRAAPRDAWDVGQLPKTAGELLTSARFRAWFVALSASLVHPLATYGRHRLERRLTAQAIREQLVPMLAGGQDPAIDELIPQAWAVLEPLVTLAPEEEAYLAAIQRGELRLDLLGPDDERFRDRVAKHPAILWKLQNVRGRAAR